MLTESALVIHRQGNQVQLELQRSSACDNCELSKGCGTGALGRLIGRRSRPLTLETDQDCKAGDTVILELPESALVRASLMLYGLPLIGLVVGGLLATFFALPDWLVACASLAGLYCGFRLASKLTQGLEQGGQAPYIREIRVNPDLIQGHKTVLETIRKFQ